MLIKNSKSKKIAEENLKHRLAMEELISFISGRFINIDIKDIDGEIKNSLKRTGEFSGADRCYFHLLSDDKKIIEECFEWNNTNTDTVNLKGLSINPAIWEENKIIRCENMDPNSHINEHIHIKSLLSIPLISQNQLMGFLGFSSEKNKRLWKEDDITLLKLLGNIFINVIKHKKLQEGLIKSQTFFRATLENISDAVFLTDDEGNFTFVCHNSHVIFGYTKEEVEKIGNIKTLFGKDIFSREELLKSLELTNIEHNISDKSGNIHVLLINVKKVNINEGTLLYTCRDITERKKVEEKLEESEKTLHILSAKLESIREEEMKRLAREIHDQLGQELTVLKMDLFWLSRKIPDGNKPLMEKIYSMLKFIDSTIQTVRNLSQRLRPVILDDLGLVAAMEWQLQEFEKRTEVKTILHSDTDEIKLKENIATTVFRIFQETITNISRHSGATEVKVTLIKEKEDIILIVEDNGKGIKEEEILSKNSFGIMGIKERISFLGGKFMIKGSSGKGTSVKIIIPSENTKMTQ